jgi:Tfp pilus assembly protein PilO
MRTRHADRLWVIAGAAVIGLLSVITWLLLVSPQRSEAAELRQQTDTAVAQAGQLRTRTAKLAAAQSRIGELTQTRENRALALPSDSGVPAFLRQLQASGTAVGVNVKAVNVGLPAAEKTAAGVWSLAIQLTADGTAAQLGAFLDQLQDSGQKRAVLIQSANLGGGDGGSGGTATSMSLDLAVKAFVAPPAGAGTPTVTAD